MTAQQTARQAALVTGSGLAAGPPQRPAGIEVTKVTSLPGLRPMMAPWARLAETAGGQNPFTHPDWLVPWAERFLRQSDRVWLLAAWRGGRLAGVAPFYLRPRAGGLAHSLQLWGTCRGSTLTELPALLLDRDSPRGIARALVSRLCAESGAWDWAEVALDDARWLEPDWLPAGGRVTVLQKLVRASVVLPVSQPGRPALKRNLRESLRRARNRLDRAYPGRWRVDRATEGRELLRAFCDLARLHDERSRIAGKKCHPNALAGDADWLFLATHLRVVSARGGAVIYRLLVDGEAVAALLALRSSDCSYVLLSGMSEESWEFSPVTLLQGCACEDAVALGHGWLNLSTGPDTAKLRWSEQVTMSPEFTLVPDRLRARLAFGAYWQASAAAAVARERKRHQAHRAG